MPFIVKATFPGSPAYASSVITNNTDTVTYSLDKKEAKRFDNLADANDEVRLRHDRVSYFLHDNNLALPADLVWETEEVEQ